VKKEEVRLLLLERGVEDVAVCSTRKRKLDVLHYADVTSGCNFCLIDVSVVVVLS
jgi:hypothetical protein